MQDRPRIIVLDGSLINPGDLSWAQLEALGAVELYPLTDDPNDVVPRCLDAEIAVTNKVAFPDEVQQALPTLRLIVVTATGYDQVDLVAAQRHGIVVCNVPGYGTDSVAEHVFALLFTLARRPELHDRQIREGAWLASNANSFWSTPQWELAGRTMGIVGWGQIGRRVGQIAATLGMDVLVTSRRRSIEPVAGVEPQWVPLEALFQRCDVISLHCPLTAQSKGLVDKRLLNLMSPRAFLINTARGGLVVEEDLVQALQAGTIAGAALDVVLHEPLDPKDPLLTAPNCLITPHLAWSTQAARQRLMDATAQNILSYLRGSPMNVVSRASS